MFGLGNRNTRNTRSHHTTHTRTSRRHHTTGATTRSTRPRHFWQRKDRDRVAGGYKAALANPNTTHAGRKHAKHELHTMGRSAHVPFMTKVKRTLGIRSTPRQKRTTTHTTRRY